jgi:hypothetical protein
MVRRGSTVRVRQRAFRKEEIPVNRGFLLSEGAPQSTSAVPPAPLSLIAPHEKCLQIAVLRRTAEHLLGAEGSTDRSMELAGNDGIRWRAVGRRDAWGQVLGREYAVAALRYGRRIVSVRPTRGRLRHQPRRGWSNCRRSRPRIDPCLPLDRIDTTNWQHDMRLRERPPRPSWQQLTAGRIARALAAPWPKSGLARLNRLRPLTSSTTSPFAELARAGARVGA